MPIRKFRLFQTVGFAALLALGACGGGNENNLAALDNELLANGADPALTSALEDQILVDPNLVQQAHPNSVRPPETPVQAQYPPASTAPEEGSGARSGQVRAPRAVAASGPGATEGVCADALERGPQWAGRLPAEFQ